MLDESGGEQTIQIKKIALTEPQRKTESPFYPLNDFTEADWQTVVNEWQRNRTDINGAIIASWMKLISPTRVEKLGLTEADMGSLAEQAQAEIGVQTIDASNFAVFAGMLRVLDPEARRKYAECYGDRTFNAVKDYFNMMISNDLAEGAVKYLFKGILAFPNGHFFPAGFLSGFKNDFVTRLYDDWHEGRFWDLIEMLSALRLADPKLFDELKVQFPLATPIKEGLQFHRELGNPQSLVEFAAYAMVTQADDIRKTEKGVTLILPKKDTQEPATPSMPVLKLT